jgi:predicted alpha/beta hydrolase
LAADSGFTPVELLSKPQLKTSVTPLWAAFWTLSHSRQIGQNGSQAICLTEIKAYYDLIQEFGVEAAMSETRMTNGLCAFHPMMIVECLGELNQAYQDRTLPRGSDMGSEAKVMHSHLSLTPWQRVRRFVDAIQRMDTIYLQYERSKQQ